MRHADIIEQFPKELQAPMCALVERLEESAAEAATGIYFPHLGTLLDRQSEHIAELAEAQARTEQRLDHLTEAVAGLAEAQQHTELRLSELAQAQARTEQRLEELAQAQARTEQRLEELAQAQARTEKRIDELAAAQLKTEQNLAALTNQVQGLRHDMDVTREELGGIAHTVGHRLEDEAMRSLPVLLARDHGIIVQGRLRRDYMEIGPGRLLEINMWGTGIKNGIPTEIIGEAKSRLAKGHVDKFLADVALIREHIGRDVTPVMVAYLATPELRGYMRDNGILYYGSYEL
jgi:hypothetical protein